MEEKVVLKKIELELYFDEKFVPPERFDNGWKSECDACPFRGWDDDPAQGWCGLNFGVVDAAERCPIRKFFEK